MSRSRSRTVPEKSNKPADAPSVPRVQGPASYFPSIERTYGQPVDHWFAVLATSGNKKHMELVAVLKTEHGIGHGHANAIVAHWLANR
jgi:Domain of unknown function (DUF4287)